MSTQLNNNDSCLPMKDQDEFDDALHQLVNSIQRPSKDEEIEELQKLLARLTSLSQSNGQRWKSILLALVHKRYHLLSPEAQSQKKIAQTEEQETKSVVSAGDGERKIFYVAVRFLMDQIIHEDKNNEKEAHCALNAILQCAPYAGGSRDVCTLLCECVDSVLQNDAKVKDIMSGDKNVSLSVLVSKGLRAVKGYLENDNYGTASSVKNLLQFAADALDNDLDLVKRNNIEKEEKEEELMSTLHVFLPHNQRGRPSKKQRRENIRYTQRQLLNSIVELLIWGQTDHAKDNPAFSISYEEFLNVSITDRESIKKKLHILQTIIRQFRKKLNSHARSQGFLLSDQFALDANQLNTKKVCRGKEGDLTKLTKLARKNADVMRMIQLRFASNPSKITKYSSATELLSNCGITENNWEIEREIHEARTKATVQYLRCLAEQKVTEKNVTVASMENTKSNHAVAALTAAALSKWPSSTNADKMVKIDTESRSIPSTKLFLAGGEHVILSFSDLMVLLDNIKEGLKNEADAPTYMDESGVATTKAVMNLMERHLQDKAVLILVSSADLSLSEDIMQGLAKKSCSVHCHNADDMNQRFAREKAQKGDITISLAWDTIDDLDLHVIVPTGEEVSYSNRASRDGLCVLDVDMNAGGSCSLEPLENVFLGKLDDGVQAPLGNYKVFVQNYAYHTKGSDQTTPIPFRLSIDKNGIEEKFDGQCVGSGSKSDVTVCEFNYEGRTIPFPKEQKDVSAFATSKIVNMTASTGQTLESIGQLVKTVQQHEQLDVLRSLDDVENDELLNTEEEAPPEDADEESSERVEEEKESPVSEENMDVTETIEEEMRPYIASSSRLEVTNRDRLNMTLAQLPVRFHQIVEKAFGEDGPSLIEKCAEEIANRMIHDRIPISELKRQGYPSEMITVIRSKIAVGAASL